MGRSRVMFFVAIATCAGASAVACAESVDATEDKPDAQTTPVWGSASNDVGGGIVLHFTGAKS
jgi:hypothetical protein